MISVSVSICMYTQALYMSLNFVSSIPRIHFLLTFQFFIPLCFTFCDMPCLCILGVSKSSGLNMCLIQFQKAMEVSLLQSNERPVLADGENRQACLSLSLLNITQLSRFTTTYWIYSVCMCAACASGKGSMLITEKMKKKSKYSVKQFLYRKIEPLKKSC